MSKLLIVHSLQQPRSSILPRMLTEGCVSRLSELVHLGNSLCLSPYLMQFFYSTRARKYKTTYWNSPRGADRTGRVPQGTGVPVSA